MPAVQQQEGARATGQRQRTATGAVVLAGA